MKDFLAGAGVLDAVPWDGQPTSISTTDVPYCQPPAEQLYDWDYSSDTLEDATQDQTPDNVLEQVLLLNVTISKCHTGILQLENALKTFSCCLRSLTACITRYNMYTAFCKQPIWLNHGHLSYVMSCSACFGLVAITWGTYFWQLYKPHTACTKAEFRAQPEPYRCDWVCQATVRDGSWKK